MSDTTKPLSERDYQQTLQSSYNGVDGSLQISGFLTGKVGHKVTVAIQTTNVLDDTEVYTFLDGANTLYELTLIYLNGTRAQLVSAERTA